jgi:hypothetical protein
MEVIIDSSVLVGLLVPNDLWHTQAVAWAGFRSSTQGRAVLIETRPTALLYDA